VYEVVRVALETAELAQALPLLSVGTDTNLQNQISGVTINEVAKKITRVVEDRLSKKCAALVDFFSQTQPQTQKDGLQIAKGFQLAQIIDTKTTQLETESQALTVDIMNNALAFWEYYHVLEKVLSALETLIITHKEKQAHVENMVVSEWLFSRLQTIQLKLQVLEGQFTTATYTKGANSSLKVIANHLQKAINEATQAHERAVSRRAQYEAVGLGFAALASEYSAVIKECAHKEWALQELSKE